MRLKKFPLMLVIAGFAVLFWFSLVPNPPQIQSNLTFIDKIEHFIAYFILSVLLLNSSEYRRDKRIFHIMVVFVIMVFVGGLIEYLQQYTGRSPDMADLIADTGGSAVGCLLYLLRRR